MSKLYPIGIQNFESLRNDGYFYVDKTALLYRLAKTGRYFFLSRPRRFGKSLMISTLQAYFEGKKELFEGLAIEQLEKEWVKRPVLHIDLNIEKYNTPDSLDKILNDTLVQWEELYGTRPSETSFSLRFAGIIRRACEKGQHALREIMQQQRQPRDKCRAHPCRRVRQADASGYRRRRTAKGFSYYAEAFLRRTQIHGRLHQIRIADRSHQIW